MDEVNKWLKKIEDVKNGNVDLSRDEDLSIALMNLISLEEHFYFTAMKTGNQRYLESLQSVREMRKKLLAASMRLYEVGCKELSTKGKKEALPYFRAGFDLWALFFAINLKLVGVKEIEKGALAEESRKMGKFSALMKKIINCCKEW